MVPSEILLQGGFTFVLVTTKAGPTATVAGTVPIQPELSVKVATCAPELTLLKV